VSRQARRCNQYFNYQVTKLHASTSRAFCAPFSGRSVAAAGAWRYASIR